MINPTITIDQLMSWKPCYSRAQVEEIANGRTEMSVMDILRLDIPIRDKLWVVLREDVLGARLLCLVSCLFAEHVLPMYEKAYPDDNRPRQAIEVARRYADGNATDDELDAVRTVAHGAIMAFANIDAREAAWYAAQAAWATAFMGAREVAWYAAWAICHAAQHTIPDVTWAAVNAAWAAERQWQVETLIKLLEEGDKNSNGN